MAHSNMFVDKWNAAAGAAAWDPTTPDHIKPGVVYTAAKVEAEREAWKWIAEHNPPFVLNTVLPNVNVRKKPSLNFFSPTSNVVAL